MVAFGLEAAKLEDFVHAAPLCLEAMRLKPSDAETLLRNVGMRKGHVRTFMKYVWQKLAPSLLHTDRFPVSWNQSQLLTVHLVDGATGAYNIPIAFWLHGSLAPCKRAFISTNVREDTA